jgi:DNA-binding transcriptional LysR family regulator
LVARLIGHTSISLYAHRSYAEGHPLPRTIEELLQHPFIGYDSLPWAQSIAMIKDIPITRDIFTLRTDSDLAQLAALRAGYGIGGCQDALARANPDLLPVLQDNVQFDLPMWLVMHEDLRSSRRVRLLYDFLGHALTAYLRGSRSAANPRPSAVDR